MGQPDGMLEWLGGVLHDRERKARAVRPLGHVVDMGGKRIDDQFTHSRVRHRAEDGAQYAESDRAAREHFDDNDPAAVLAQVAAHRAILAEHTGSRSYVYTDDGTPACDVCGDGTVRWPCPTVRHLATAYAGRDGYDPSWRPE